MLVNPWIQIYYTGDPFLRWWKEALLREYPNDFNI